MWPSTDDQYEVSSVLRKKKLYRQGPESLTNFDTYSERQLFIKLFVASSFKCFGSGRNSPEISVILGDRGSVAGPRTKWMNSFAMRKG